MLHAWVKKLSISCDDAKTLVIKYFSEINSKYLVHTTLYFFGFMW